MAKIPHIGIISLGCSKNLVDSERLTSVLVAKGYAIADDYESADLVVINTCGFINDAQMESCQAIDEALKEVRYVIVCGCLGHEKEQIMKLFPRVFAVLGPSMRTGVLRAIAQAVGEPPIEARQRVAHSGIKLTPRHYSYVKVAEGCDHGCSFCIIPTLRGRQISRSVESIVKECADLVENGTRELLLISQDTSDYGTDLKDGTNLETLLNALSGLKAWVRLHYMYPNRMADRAVELMAEGKVLPYIDVPFQHANARILKLMKRPHNLERTLRTIEKWRSVCPDIAIRSTFIVGFPTEREIEFQELLDFLKEARLSRVGCFAYSEVHGAEANNLKRHVRDSVKQERLTRLMKTQEEISRQNLLGRVGKEYTLIIDEVTERGTALARSKYESPDVDGEITVENAQGLRPGDFVRATITTSGVHDLTAKISPPTSKNAIHFKQRQSK